MSRVPELRGAHCTLHGSPSRESGTRVLAARGHTPGKWERNPQLIHSTGPHSISNLECGSVKKADKDASTAFSP